MPIGRDPLNMLQLVPGVQAATGYATVGTITTGNPGRTILLTLRFHY